MKFVAALPIFFVGGLLTCGASCRSVLRKRDINSSKPECTHVALDEWSDASHAAFRVGCGEMVDTLYTASKDNQSTEFVSANQVSGTVLPQYHSEKTCMIAINQAAYSSTFVADVSISEIFEAAFKLYSQCVSERSAPPGSFGGTEYFHNDSLTLTFSYAPTPGLASTVS